MHSIAFTRAQKADSLVMRSVCLFAFKCVRKSVYQSGLFNVFSLTASCATDTERFSAAILGVIRMILLVALSASSIPPGSFPNC